jgi:propionyl-CoA carboxylase alpha chain
MKRKKMIDLLSVSFFQRSNSLAPSSQQHNGLRFVSTTTTPRMAAQPAPKEPNTTDTRLFNKILVANRGEIAIRVMRTAKRLGIPTVAIYSDADANALHTRFADEAYNIGPPPSAQSYLRIDAITDVIRKTGADAVHPGYGFLSENPLFDEAVTAAGATFVGPPAFAVRAMGDKVESKRFAKEAGVNTIPGYIGVVENADHAVAVAKEIGYPVMVKASAGGGGKGMRIAYTDKEVVEVFKLCTDEAASAFGDSRMLVEKFIEQPRHIEIQVLGDKHGNVISLPERECSIQRRNQKVIEEAPSPVGTVELRTAMGGQAVALCRAVGYHSAGTCEFMVDKDKNFYFLEMNTRLQVEHPITEAITGIDLVEQMLRVAAGEKLNISQERAFQITGHAIEARVYAEDPARGFLPSIGTLKHYQEPQGPGVRNDSGVGEGSEISVYYDPMICKLLTHAADRQSALASMRRALDSYVVRGVQHNIPLLRSVMDVPAFASGDYSTAFLAETYPTPEASGPRALPLSHTQEQELLAVAAAAHVRNEKRVSIPGTFPAEHAFILAINDEHVPVAIKLASSDFTITPPSSSSSSESGGGGEAWEVSLPDRVMTIRFPPPHSYSNYLRLEALLDESKELILQLIDSKPTSMLLQHCGAQRMIRITRPEVASLFPYMPEPMIEDSSKLIKSPMPGVLVSVMVRVGDDVMPGDEVAVVEAMKMRNVLRAEVEGRVIEVGGKEGSTVAADEVLVRFE